MVRSLSLRWLQRLFRRLPQKIGTDCIRMQQELEPQSASVDSGFSALSAGAG
jgi:hypothetical protein